MPAAEGERPSPALALLAVPLLFWPAALNWHPYLFWDTYGYFLQGKAYATVALAALGLGPPPPEAAGGLVGAAGRMLAGDASIRSPTFSLLLYGLAATGGFWLTAALNALAAGFALEVSLARLLGLPPGRRLAVLLALTVASTLPWFAVFLMPDLAAGLMILAMATLAFAWPRLPGRERLFLLALALLAASFHGSHLLLAAGLVPLAWLLAERGDKGWAALRLALPVLGAAGLLILAGWLAFGRPTPTPQAPPFLLARAWEDGPVRAYLAARCPREPWTLCRHLGGLPPTAQEFLWAKERSYWAMDIATRAAVRAEAGALLARALAAHPLTQLEAALRNTGRQLARFGLDDLVRGRGALVTPEDYTFLYLPEAPAARRGLAPFEAALHAAFALALLALAAWLLRHRAAPQARVALLVLAGLLLNAAICGALSGPHDRYQARVAWLVPLLAVGLWLSPRAAGRPAPPGPAPTGSGARPAPRATP